MAHLLAVRFPLPALLGRLIIMQARFLYLFGWLRAVFCGTVEICALPPIIFCYRTFSPGVTGHFLCMDLHVTNLFIIESGLLIIFRISLFACMFTALMIQYCCIKPSAWGPAFPALSSMKHMQSPAVAWLCRKAFGVRISFHVTQNYRAVLQPS